MYLLKYDNEGEEMKKIDRVNMIIYSAAGVLVGGIIGGTLVMNLHKRELQPMQPVSVDEVRATEPAESIPYPNFSVTTMTFTCTTTTTTLTTTTTTTTAPPPPPLDVQGVSEVLSPIKEALSMKYHYSDTDTYEYYSEWGGFRLPFTTESAKYSYQGVITVGIDPAKIEAAVNNMFDQITIKMPKPEILLNELDEDSIQFYDVHTPLFGGSGMTDYRGIVTKMKKKHSEIVMKDTAFLKEVADHAENAVREYLMQNEKTSRFKVEFGELPKQEGVTFEFLPAAGEIPSEPVEPAEAETPEEPVIPMDPEYLPEPDYPDLPDSELQGMGEEEPEIPDVPEEQPEEPVWIPDPTALYHF